MDVIFNYLQDNKMVLIVILGLIAWGFYRLTAKPAAQMKNRGVVPSHVRFDRREHEQPDRRVSDLLTAGAVERRQSRRRS